MARGPALRALGVIAALLVCAWFALGTRQSLDTDAASAIVSQSGRLSAAQARRAADLLAAAGQLNPDRGLDLTRSQLAVREGDRARGRAIALAVARAEPQSIQAGLTYGNASGDDPSADRLARRRAEALVAPVP
ncbi:MAG: hypothetical protein ACRDMX_10740 [Solirubrobacteraceae bacterium]